MNFAVARKTGFKNVMARRYWNGRFGYLNKESGDGPDTTECCDDGSVVKWRAYVSAVDGTKYLGLVIDASWAQTIYDYSGGGSPTSSTVTETMSMTQAIDAASGLYTFSDLTISPNDDRNHALQPFSPALWKWSDIIARMTVEIVPLTDDAHKILHREFHHASRTTSIAWWNKSRGILAREPFARQVYQWSSTRARNCSRRTNRSPSQIPRSLIR